MSGTSCRYSVDLSGLHATCESNYARLMQLFPDYETANHREFHLGSGQRVRIEVLERCRYTTILKVYQHGDNHQRMLPHWIASPSFDLRVYHDARMVEVTGFHSLRRVKARYEYPNAAMLARDEKIQQNIFLAEWLSHCLEQGRSADGMEPNGAPTLGTS